MPAHAILLVQLEERIQRTYVEYDCDKDWIEGLCAMYEERTSGAIPDALMVTYNISELLDFVDSFYVIKCLVYEESTSTYALFCKWWIKDKILEYIRQAAEQNE